MIFDNNSYAIITEKSTGVGAFELLIDPLAKTAYPGIRPKYDVEPEIRDAQWLWHDGRWRYDGQLPTTTEC